MDRLGAMEAFVAVVDQGGFTDAAKKLGISKSAVSKHVSALEKILGVRLLNRTTRRVSPTEIGLAYYDQVVKVLDDARAANEMVSSMQANPSGILKVSAPIDIGIYRLPEILGKFMAEYKDVTIKLNLENQYVDMADGKYDVAIRVSNSVDTNLQSRLLSKAKIVFVASKKYLDAHGVPKTIDDLNEHSLLHYSNLSTGNTWHIASATGEQRQVRAVGRLTINNGASLLSAVEANLGIARVPCFIAQDNIRNGKVIEVLPDLPVASSDVYAVYPHGKYTQPKIRAFVDFMSDNFDDIING